ncbi:hypothetical protein DDE05_43845 [Streptomyces cavourensis]|jgi:hypothetical protein|uniref:hypothetical protein n=1 Tax=unclassified Achromobacter TaxID=2626865 RepID=UPI000DFB96C6|nr:hypothetical protein DDE05_43845 [Streptomyces cavourensis]
MSTWELASTVAALAAVAGGVLMHYPGAVLYDMVATRLRRQPSARPGVAQPKPAPRAGRAQPVPAARLHNLAQ